MSNRGTPIRNDFGSFIRKFEEDLRKAAENFQLLVRRVEAGIQRFEGNWTAFVGNFSGVHRAFLRHGYVPSSPLLAHRGGIQDIDPVSVARLYAEKLRRNNVHDTARVMDEMVATIPVSSPINIVRSIFPEIERVARTQTYVEGVTDQITSLPALRIELNKQIADGSKTLEALTETLGELDLFILTIASAFDFAYSSKDKLGNPKPEAILFRHAFRHVPNRHKVLHGVVDECGNLEVVNALTLLFAMARIGAYFSARNIRVSALAPDQTNSLARWRASRRHLNNSATRLWSTLAGKSRNNPLAPASKEPA